MPMPAKPESVGLPPQTFLYTLDQLATMLNMSQHQFEARYVWYPQRSTGRKRPDEMRAQNIADPTERPDWRIPQQEFIRWLKLKGISVKHTMVIG